MGKIDLSAEEQRQLDKTKASPTGGYSVVLNPSVEGQPWSWYNDPRTNKRMWLPCDPISFRTYLNKGYQLVGEPTEQPLPNTPSEETLPTNVQEIVNAAVQAALKAVGYAPAEPEVSVEPKQLEFQF